MYVEYLRYVYNVLCDYNSYGSNELRVWSVTVEVRSGIACERAWDVKAVDVYIYIYI